MRYLIDLLTHAVRDAPGGSRNSNLLREMQETVTGQLLSETVHVASPAFQAWFSGSKVVDADGHPLPVYHGTARPDRVGAQFRKSRATAGPMAYFTDDAAIASSYATGKADTSMPDDIQYADWFQVRVPGSRSTVAINKAWRLLTGEQRAKMAALAPRVMSEEGEVLLADEEHTSGVGSYEYEIRRYRGDVLAALAESWLTTGAIFDEEELFMQVLRLAGFPLPVSYEHPNASYPFVYRVYLSIKNPLVSTAIPQPVLDALSKAVASQRTPSAVGGSWDKKRIDPRMWLRDLLDDLESRDGVNSWTTVPDWVTATLRRLGYDGIRDIGGKNGGQDHTVWIPFDEHQVKSAVSNGGKFDPSKKGIHQ